MTKALINGFNITPATKQFEKISEDQLPIAASDKAYQWLQFDLKSPETEKLIRGIEGADELLVEALLKDETRPRVSILNDEMLIILRGVNLSEGEDPEDMVAVRLLISSNRIISCQKRNLLSVNDMVQSIEDGKPPKTPAHFLVLLCERLILRMNDLMEDIEDRSAEMEELALDNDGSDFESELHNLRRQIIQLKRFLIPQRDAFLKLQLEKTAWITIKQQHRFREITDQLIRYLEMLDAARDMATVSQETLYHRQNEQMNKRMYILSIAAAIFLPLGFFAGLLGVNLSGIPKAEDPMAFAWFVIILAVLTGFLLLLFWKKKWL
ncbi:zinc transporter ZntB [Sunxiuqinia sp. A32]|uniref:zinc transporter ZntB n=1 Tax=Sunxiuqinia sp. A32 TaxID=3461496 RepID=UPI0040456ADB